MAKSCLVASLVTCQKLLIFLARFWSGHHGQILRSLVTYGQILPGSIIVTCQNLMVILARFWSHHHGQILHGSITSDLSEPYGNLGKSLVRSLWPNHTFKTSHELDKMNERERCSPIHHAKIIFWPPKY